jgi:hypothetical protein
MRRAGLYAVTGAPHNNGMHPTPFSLPLMNLEWGRG